MLSSLVTTIICAFGIAVILVNIDNWPVRGIRIRLQWFVHLFYWRASQALFCAACTSFWAALIVDSALYFTGHHWFLWPFSGFAAAGVIYTVFAYINSQYD